MIKLAKLNEKHLTPLTQVMYNGNGEHNDTFKLLELNKNLLAAIEEGQILSFKGEPPNRFVYSFLFVLITFPIAGGLNEKVVLCTETQTFEVKEAGISNSVLLVPELKFGQATSRSPLKSPKNRANSSMDKQNDSTGSIEDEELFDADAERNQELRTVTKVFHEYFELREINPKFRKLGDLLQLTRYSGPEHEYAIDRSLLFTFDQLLSTTQCSKREFEAGLQSYRAFEYDGRMRIFDIEYEYRLLSLLLGIVTENSWPIDSIDRDETLAAITETIAPADIVREMFNLYTRPSTRQSGSSSTLFEYKGDMVCRTIAMNILEQGDKFHYDDFMQTWQSALPDGFQVQVNLKKIFSNFLIKIKFWIFYKFSNNFLVFVWCRRTFFEASAS